MAADRPLTLITGGTRGIGAATATRLASDGHDLVLGYLGDDEAADATAAMVRSRGTACTLVKGDLTTDAGIDALFAAAPRTLTGVVNNAGATYRYAPLTEWEPAMIRKVIDLNLTAAVLVARTAVDAMTGGGVIVNVSSGAATLGSPGEYVHYAAAKAGVDAMTKGLGIEVADRGIRVVGIAPGLVDTDLHANSGDPDRTSRMAPQLPVGRAADPAEIADAIAYALSDQATYVTATTIRVAGGR